MYNYIVIQYVSFLHTLTLFVFDLLCCSDILCGSGWAIKYWYNIMLAFDHAFAYREIDQFRAPIHGTERAMCRMHDAQETIK